MPFYLLKCCYGTDTTSAYTNKLHRLDVGVSEPFNKFYNVAADNWLMQHPGQAFAIENMVVAGCVNAAHQKAVTSAHIVSFP